ncbi:hypothetical protein TSOC_006968 [Tetrabaena socialis]|uniref:Uncharacterized protein n=1 Tax=Tetrabaena socialis TaxID=47790 RepID=A0A2J8A2B4_9CHLO|nr:hypothetical protein TSOC_006968 [Tetrabaena socialis]|eukprot:PNH06657.1 hypothetical protein TSOC_006968 [Tetrabaena socialis]
MAVPRLRRTSCRLVFVPSSPPEQRVRPLKREAHLEQEHEDSTNIYYGNIIDKYNKRHKYHKRCSMNALREWYGSAWEERVQQAGEASTLQELQEGYHFAWDMPKQDYSQQEVAPSRRLDLARTTNLLPERDYFDCVCALNLGQRRYINHFLHMIKHSPADKPLRDLLSGRGMGTTTLADVLAAIHWFAPRSKAPPDAVIVLKLAPTGKAAFNIHGSTIHSGLYSG